MEWEGTDLDQVLKWLERAKASRYLGERRLDPFATSMRDFDDVTQDLQLIKERSETSKKDSAQRITDLKRAGLVVDANTNLSILGLETLESWERYKVANKNIEDELARHLILLKKAIELNHPLYQSFVNYWGELKKRYDPFRLIENWNALYVLNYLDHPTNGYNPGGRYNKDTVPISDIKFDLTDIAKKKKGSKQAVSGAERINRAIAGKIPRGRHRATFCCALEILDSGGKSMERILERFGVPERPRSWSNFEASHKETIRNIAIDFGLMENGNEETQLSTVGSDIDDINDSQEVMDSNYELSLPDYIDFENVLIIPPEKKVHSEAGIQESPTKRTKLDYVAKALVSKQIGDLGEEFALRFERWRLRNYPELEAQIKHVSRDDDTAGYDILSYEEDGSPRFVEVKSTAGELDTPFFISAHEYEVANEKMDKYFILRVFNLKDSPQCCELRFPFEDIIELAPSTYIATFR